MPAKGWKKNTDGEYVAPGAWDHPDTVANAAAHGTATIDEVEPSTADLPPVEAPSLPDYPAARSLTPDEAESLADATYVEPDAPLPDWSQGVGDDPESAVAYWVGSLPGCPSQNPIVGGISFPLRTQAVGPGGIGTLTTRSDQKGSIAYLTASQVKKIMHGARALVVRKKGQGAGARQIILNADPAHFVSDKANPGMKVREYVRQRGDMPIGCYIYMVPYNNALGPNYQASWPEPMIARPPDAED